MSPPDLSVLIVSYNSRPFIGHCIASVRSTAERHRVEVIVTDNASPDGPFTRRVPPREGDDVTVIDMGRNAGFAAACNAAIAASSGRHLLLLNPDTLVTPGALDLMVDFLDSEPRAGAVGPKLLNPDGSDQGTARSFPTPAAAVFGRRSPVTRAFPHNRFSKRYLSGRDYAGSEPFEVDWLSGACLMVPRRVADQVGVLDEAYFMYWEDADWCRRIKLAGYSVHCVASSEVVHDEGVRRGASAQQVRWFHQSAYRYWSKHHASGPRAVLRPLAWGALQSRASAVIIHSHLAGRSALPATRSTEMQAAIERTQ